MIPLLQLQRWTSHRPHLDTKCIFRLSSTIIPTKKTSVNVKRSIVLSVDKINGHGDGVGTYITDEGLKMQVQVPYTAPGDKLQVEIWDGDVEFRGQWAAHKSQDTWPLFGQQRGVLEPSDHRVHPLCSKYFGKCGGCKMQHVSYAWQLVEKQEWIQQLFALRAHSPDMEIREIKGVENGGDGIYHYRNKMEFTCSTGRWLLDEDKFTDHGYTAAVSSCYPFTVGMFPVTSVSARRSKQVYGKKKARQRRAAVWSPKILSLDECLLQSSACNRLLQELVTKCKNANLQAYDFKTHDGFLKQIVLRRGVNRDGGTEIMLGLVTTTFDGEQSELLQSIVNSIVQDYENDRFATTSDRSRLVSVVESLDCEAHRHWRKKNNVTNDLTEGIAAERVLYGNSHLEDTILNHKFKISFGSFFQPNTAQASVLYREIQVMMESLTEKPVVWDLFCGVGSIGICVGAYSKTVVGFELVHAAVEHAKFNARLNGYAPNHMQFFCVDLTKNWHEEELQEQIQSCSNVVSSELPDMVILDPPRAGLHKKLIKMVRRMAPRHICYVSCNPHTQASDLEAFCKDAKPEAGESFTYRVMHLQPVDMLPHTSHVETIAWLERCDESG